MRAFYPLPLFGRTSELDFLKERFRDPGSLVTLVGPPGAGKTRLVAEFVRSIPEKSLLIELRGSRTQGQLLQQIATAMGSVSDARTDAELAASLEKQLRQDPPLVLVLDGVEQHVDDLSFVSHWVSDLHIAKALMTSRRRIDVDQGVALQVDPLDGESATDLFLSAAGLATGFHDWEDADREAAARLAERLDCIPLLLEMAASRTRVMSIEQLCRRLESDLALLSRQPATRDGTPSSLRSTLDWSWNLLSKAARTALVGCASFSGWFDLEAAEAMMGGVPALDRKPADAFQELIDNSLLATDRGPRNLTFRLYDAVREYAIGMAETIESAREMQLAYAHYQIERNRHLAAQSSSEPAEAGEACRSAVAELDDTRQAIAILLDDEPELAAALALSTARTIYGYAPRREIEALLSSVLLDEPSPTATSVGLLAHRAGMRQGLFETEGAMLDSSRAASLAEKLGPDLTPESAEAVSDAFRVHAIVLVARRERDLATHFVERAARVASQANLTDSLAKSLVISYGIDPERSKTTFNKLVGLAPSVKSPRDRAYVMNYLANASASPTEKIRWSTRALELATATRHKLGRAQALSVLGDALHVEGRYSESARTLREAAHRSVGLSLNAEVMSRLNLAAVLQILGDWESSRELLEDCETRLEEKKLQYPLPQVRAFQAATEARNNRREAAVALLLRAKEGGASEMLEVLWGMVDLLDCRRAYEEGDLARAQDALAKAASRLELDPEGVGVGTSKSVLEQEILRLPEWADEWHNPSGLVVGPGGAWFRTEGNPRVWVTKRPNLTRLLVRLAEARTEAGDTIVASDELVRAGWPGESMTDASGNQRLRTAIRTLRKMGLDGFVVTAKAGYHLDPNTALTKVEPFLPDEIAADPNATA